MSTFEPFRVIYDDAPFRKYVQAAIAGEPILPDPDPEIVAKIQKFRDANPDLEIYQNYGQPRAPGGQFEDDRSAFDGEPGDELIIEREPIDE